MAKLQIPIDDELMMEAKMFALKNKITLKDLVIKAIEREIATTTDNTSIADTSEDENLEYFFEPFELPAHRVERPEEQINTIRKEDLDPNDPLEAMMLKQYEMFGD